MRAHLSALLSLSLLVACGDDDDSSDDTVDMSRTDGGEPTDLGGGGTDAFVATDAFSEPDACMDRELTAETLLRPVDVILVADNSASMTAELAELEENLNAAFADVFTDAGVDMQLIVITDHGSASTDLCVPMPLSATTNCDGAPGEIAGQFHHYDAQVGSRNAACMVLDTLAGSNAGGTADQFGNHPDGWVELLREGAFTGFIVLSDDRMGCEWDGPGLMTDISTCTTGDGCLNDNESTSTSSSGVAATAASRFFDLLRARVPELGDGGAPNFAWHSLVSLEERAGGDVPYPPTDPIVAAECFSGGGLGTGYQWLSRGTGGLRAPVCNTSSYADYLEAIADSLIAGAADPCELSAPDGEAFSGVRLTPADASPVELTAVATSDDCAADDQFYFDGTTAILCPLACDALEDTDTVTLLATCD